MITTKQILHARFHFPAADAGLYGQLLDLAGNITPRVQPIPPDAADLDITGALRYWQCGAEDLAALLRMRTIGLHGVRTTCAVAPNRMLAAMTAASTPFGAAAVLTEEEVTAWLRPRPVAALHGVGPATAASLAAYGLHTIGDLADAPLPALTRIFGSATGRALHTRAHGQDLRPVDAHPVPKSLSAGHPFEADCLDADQHHRALLGLAHRLGASLRDEDRAATGLTLTVRYADRSTSTRTRTLTEPTNHTRPLTGTAYELYGLLGLQRARVRSFDLRAESLCPASEARRQLTFDAADDQALAVEAAADRARARYGPDAVRPATLAGTVPR
ncbi:DNA polymerase Y family protein [Streptomyces sp. 4.24]|uniref:DNA polymerase Y family protein n=1 Tax=Streptomyces tritrimontium TaxID=3406573 RepID=UPI003BB59DFE